MDWNNLTTTEQLDEIDELSKKQAVLIYKHSTRCGICSTALSRLERKWEASDNSRVRPFYLDILRYREISNEIASRYGVAHESPQVLLIRNGRCIFSQTHMDITYDAVISAAA